nr:hypothetical protein Iba_scaffold1679633CG0010 [Ipomoea batatas]
MSLSILSSRVASMFLHLYGLKKSLLEHLHLGAITMDLLLLEQRHLNQKAIGGLQVLSPTQSPLVTSLLPSPMCP